MTHVKKFKLRWRNEVRIKVFFKTDKLPIPYRQRFMALIKKILSKQSPEYKKILYPDQGSSHSKKVKPDIFGDETVAAAILDRLLHHSYPFFINGKSYRIKQLYEKIDVEKK